ncbi:Uncharacterized protein FWK35_00014359, partial [Aphis craccivora]
PPSSYRPRELRDSSPTPKLVRLIARASRLIIERVVIPWQGGLAGETAVFVCHDRVKV